MFDRAYPTCTTIMDCFLLKRFDMNDLVTLNGQDKGNQRHTPNDINCVLKNINKMICFDIMGVFLVVSNILIFVNCLRVAREFYETFMSIS